METIMLESLTKRRRGYIRYGKVKVLPIKRSSDWLPETSDSAFMNTGAKVEYVVPRMRNSGVLVDPLQDLSDEQKIKLAKEFGLSNADSFNVMKPEKENFWINRAVIIDKNGRFFDLSSAADFINYKILEVNLETIAPSWEERYQKGTYKFALVFEDEEAKIKTSKIDIKKEAYMTFGKIDGSSKKLNDVLWIYYLTNKEGKRPTNNASLDYLKSEVGRIVEESPAEFLSIVTDTQFETKALIQKAINLGLIHRDGHTFKIYNEESSKNTLDGLIAFLLDERNNNIRVSLLGRISAFEEGEMKVKVTEKEKQDLNNTEQVVQNKEKSEFDKRFESLETATKKALEDNNLLKEQNKVLAQENQKLADEVSKLKGPKKGRPVKEKKDEE